MIALAVIADDLTGAADTAVQFCSNFPKVFLTSLSYMEKAMASAKNQGTHEVLAVHTDSRALSPSDARKRLEAVAMSLQSSTPSLIYKKVDSCLRGNIGAETQTLMESLDFDASAIAPAYPAMDRITKDDIHLIRGKPVGQSEISTDPVTPVRDSRLSRIITSQSNLPIEKIGLEQLEGDKGLLFDKITAILRRGKVHLVFDATEERHLEAIANLVLEAPRRLLPVGSAGLARAIAKRLPGHANQPAASALMRGPGHGYHLVICGSASEIARAQMDALAQQRGYQRLELDTETLGDRAITEDLTSFSLRGASILARSHLILSTTPLPLAPTCPSGCSIDPREIVRGLGLVVSMVIKRTAPGSLFMTGGDTAATVLECIGAAGLSLRGEIFPGVVVGNIVGGDLDGLPVATKAGAFGDRDTLVRLHDKWYGGAAMANENEGYDGK